MDILALSAMIAAAIAEIVPQEELPLTAILLTSIADNIALLDVCKTAKE